MAVSANPRTRSERDDHPALRRHHHWYRRWRWHAGPQAGAVGQAGPAAGAWRLPAPRGRGLGGARGLYQPPLPFRRVLVRQGRPRLQAPPAVLRRRQHKVLRRGPVPPARAGLRRGPALRRALTGVADLLSGPGALLHSGGAALSGARAGRRRPHRATALGAVSLPGGVARATYPAALRRPRGSPAPAPPPPPS